MSMHLSPPPSPLPTLLDTFMQTPSTSASATHPHSENVYPDANAAKPTPTRRRSARLSIPTPLPVAPEHPPAQVSEWTVPFPSGPSSSSAPSTPMPNASATPTRTRTRKRARPSESGEVARKAVEALVTPSRSRKSRSPMRVDTQEGAAKVGDRGSEKKRRKVSPVKGMQEEEGVSGMEVEVAMPHAVPRRGRMRSTAGVEKVEISASTATPSTSATAITATPTPTRPNHRKRKSMSALDDIRRELAVTPALDEQATPPQSTRKKLRKSADVDSEGPVKGSTVTFAVDGKGKGREKERSPARGKRGSRAGKSVLASTSGEVSVHTEDVEMAEAPPATVAPAPKLGRRKSMRKLAASVQDSSTNVPSEDPISPLPSNPTPHTPLGAAAAILASTSNAGTLSPSALTSPSSSPSAPARRFTRSSLAINTQDPVVAPAHTSPLSDTRQLSPLSPPTSPLSTMSSLDLPLSPNQVASAQTQAKAPAKLVAEAAVAASSRSTSGSGSGRASGSAVLPTRRIATRSSGLPLIVAEWGVAAGSGRRRRTPSSPLAAVGSTVPESPEKDKAGPEQEVPVEEGSAKGKEKEVQVQTVRGGKGKAGRKRGGGVRMRGPARRSSRLSGASERDSTPTATVQPGPQPLPAPIVSPSPVQHQPQSHTPPSSPPSPPPLRLSLASLSPPMPASGHKPHTRSPLSASSSHQGQHSGATSPLKEGSISPLKENASLSNIGSTSSSGGLGNSAPTSSSPNLGDRPSNGKQTQGMQGSTKSMQSHTPPGSPTRASMAMQMEIDAVDFGTPLPGPMQFNSQIQTSPPHSSSQQQQGGSGSGKQVERPGSPTSPTERRIPLMPSTLLGVGAAPVKFDGDGVVGEKADVGKERERERSGVEEVESGKGVEEGSSIPQVELGGLVQLPASTISVTSDVVPLASSEPVLDENTPPPQQPLYPALIQVEIPPAPQPPQPQVQLEQGQQQFGDSAQVFEGQAEQQQQQQQDVNVQYQQQQYTPPPPPQPAYTQWEEPPRLDNERSLWRLACKVRVWDLRRRYSLETIRSLVTHEAHEYYAKNGFPTGYFTPSPSSPYGSAGPSLPSGFNAAGLRTHAGQLRAQALRRQVSGSSTSSEGDPTSPVNFMDEEVYDWEIATSDDEEGFLVEEDEDEDEEDYEDVYDDDDDEEEEEGEVGDMEGDQVENEGEGAAPATTLEVGEEGEKKEGGEEDKDKERETSVEVEGENEEERLKRRRRRSSLLRHLRKPSGEFDEARSPSPAVQDDPTKSGDLNEGEQGEGDMDIDIDLDIEDLDEALEDPNFNLELSASTTASPTSPQQVSPASPSPIGSPTSGPSNGVFTSFYVPPVPQVFSPQSLPAAIADPSTSALSAALGTPVEAAASSPSSPAPTSSLLMDGTVSSSPPPPAEVLPPVQIPLQTIAIPMHIPSPTPPPIIDMPPPRLSSVPVWALRNMEMSGGNMGKGTPVNRDRATEWGNVWSMDVVRSRAVSVMAVDGGSITKKDGDDFSMNVDRGSGSGDGGKPVLRLSLPGEGDASSSGPAGTSASMGPSGSKQAMLMDGTFEPSNQADWEAFLASLAPGPGGSSSSSSCLLGAQSMMQQGIPDHHQAPPPPYSSHNPNPLQQSPPPTPTPPSPASSTSSLHENMAALGGGSMTIHSPGTSQAGSNGMMNPAGMFGMMNVNMMFGVPGSQGGGNTYPQQVQPQPHSQVPMQQQQQQQQGINDGSLNQPSFPPMGLTMQMPPTMNSMGPQHGSYNSGMQQSFNSMPFNMGMGLGMNPQTMNMNVPLNMNMGMGTMSMPMMQMPMSMPFAGLQLGLTVSLAPHQHSAQHHQQQAQQQQNQIQWNMNGGAQGGGSMEYDLASGMGMGPGGPMGEGMFSLVNGTPANTPLNSPLSPPSASIPSSMLGVLGGVGLSSSGPMSPESEKGSSAPATSSTLSYALG